MTAYNLAPPWESGDALPDYVRVEDLQRRSFVTRQMPRGTYDPAAVGTGGYMVPNYVMAEGTGKGVTVTKWLPRGTAPRVDQFIQTPQSRLVSARATASGNGTNYVITTGRPDVQPFRAYGTKVANYVMSSIKSLPPAARKPAIKKLFDRIDPQLWKNVHATATQAAKAGVPPARALHHAITVNFHRGIVSELAEVSATGRVKRQSHVGLGCFGCAAIGLGDDATVPGHWERTSKADNSPCKYKWVGSGPAPAVDPSGCKQPTVTNVHVSNDPADILQQSQGVDLSKMVTGLLPYCGTKDRNGVEIKPCNPNVPAGFGKIIAFGPWQFSGDSTVASQNISYKTPADIPPVVKDYLLKILTPLLTHYGTTLYGDYNPMKYWFGLTDDSKEVDHAYNQDGGLDKNIAEKPIGPTMIHPYNGKKYGIFLWMSTNLDPLPPDSPPGTPRTGPYFMIRFADVDAAAKSREGSTSGGFWDTIGSAASAVGDWLTGAATAVASAACEAVQQPGAMQAASADPRAAAGVIAAKAACGPGAQPATPTPATPVPVVAPPGSGLSLETILLLGGAGLAALYLLTSGD